MKSALTKSALKLIACLIFLVIPLCAFAQSSGQEYFEQGNSLYNQKKYDQAVASYGRAIQAQPLSLPKAYLNCARAYSMKKDYAASAQYYAFYEVVALDTESDKKFKAEYNAVAKKAKKLTYVRDTAQTMVLSQLEQAISANGPYLTAQGNGAFAFYDVLIRSGFAEPELYDIQKKLVRGLIDEITSDVMPIEGQPLPNLDRTGWEFIRNKIARARQFLDAPPDDNFLKSVESLALAWESYYRGDYESAKSGFDVACAATPKLPAAFWGRIMLKFQLDDNESLISLINEAEKIYQDAGLLNMERHFALLRAQAYRNLGDIPNSLKELDVIYKAF